MSTRSSMRGALFACACLATTPAVALAQPVPPARLSVATDGAQANGHSQLLDISRDGRQVLFWSAATNLVAGDTNAVADLFVRDRDTDRDGVLDEPASVRTIRVSQGLAGQQPTLGTLSGALSPDGRFVLFQTADALVASDTNGVMDAYLRDRDTDADGVFDEDGAVSMEQVSTGTGGTQADQFSAPLTMTASGRFVLFSSAATTLQPRPVNGVTQIYRKDRLTGVTTLVSSLPDGTPADRSPWAAAMTGDGRLVAIAEGFGALMPTDPAAPRYPWVLRDLAANTFTPIPLAAAPADSAPAAGTTAAPFISHHQTVFGFSPDDRRLYLGDVLALVSVGFYSVSGVTFEYDVAAGAFTGRIPGIPPQAAAVTLGQDIFEGGTTFTHTASIFSGVAATSADGIGRYDPATGRSTAIVGGAVSFGFDRAGDRTLYAAAAAPAVPPGPALMLDGRFGVPLPMPDPVRVGELDAAGTMTIFTSSEATILDGGADTNGVSDVFAVDLASRLDRDADTLDDRWEAAMGLDFTSAAGADGPAGDPDGDGQTNAAEEDAETHPRGTVRQFLAEGAENAFFTTRIGLANAGSTATTAVVRFDGDDGTSAPVNVHVPAGAKRTLFVDELAVPTASFATVVDASAPLVTERIMSWDAMGYGAHAERASAAPATTWFLAEGATGAFSLFYLLQNPGDTAASATIRYLRPAPLPPIERTYALPPHTRVTLPVNVQAPELASTDVSASITATAPILVERAMYRSVGGQPFAAGHASAGVTAASTSWFLAEGATGDFFDLFVLLANPNPTAAEVEVRYLLSGGTVLTKSYTVAGESRRTIYVDAEDFGQLGQALASATLSCSITVANGVPIVVERAMWFPGPAVSPLFWTEAHNSPGATGTATRWVLADGESGGPRDTQTFVLIANTSATAGRVRVTLLPDQPTADGSVPPPPPIEAVFDLPPNSRTTVPMGPPPFGTAGRRFGVVVESIETTPPADIVVERAMYWNAGGVTWAAGTNLLATPVP